MKPKITKERKELEERFIGRIVVAPHSFPTQRSTFQIPSFITPPSMAEAPEPSTATSHRKVRVIAKIRGVVQTPSKWISVSKSHHSSSVSFLDHSGNTAGKHTYELDHCYEPDNDNSTIFTAEIKPLVSSVFAGRCASVVAFGATASGKSYTIQGSDTDPGLAVLAMEEFLLMADRAGRSVAVSYYEVYHDQVYDLLNRNESAVSVLENARGKIQLKGLSQTFVKSMVDFQKLYVADSYKKTQKIASHSSRRSHKGLMIHLFSSDENANDHQLVGRMNFIDLAGFGDPRKKSVDTYTLAENSRINKSLYALQSVVYALNCNDSRVPYRDSKLTYMLRDSLSGKNKILMIACLNPTVCQDTVYMVNLASRCTKSSHRMFMDSLRKVKSAQKFMVDLPSKDEEKPVRNSSARNAKYSGLKKKLTSSRLPLSENRINNVGVAALMWGSKQFNEVKQEYAVEKVTVPVDIVSDTLLQTPQECVSCSLEIDSAVAPETTQMENCLEVSDSPVLQASIYEGKQMSAGPEGTSPPSARLHELSSLDEEKQMSAGPEGASPPLSARLQELSNYLKSLQSATSLHSDIVQKLDVTIVDPKTPAANTYTSDHYLTSNIDDALQPKGDTTNSTNFAEPVTPVARTNNSNNHNWDDVVISSPWTALNVRSAGVKNCLTQECVRFINSATKEELKGLKGIGDKRATYIMQLREKSPEHFKNIDDLKDVGLSAKQIKTMMKNIAGDMFD